MISYYSTITGFSRVGSNGSGPYWQLRGSFGTDWGVNGLMYIEKQNDNPDPYGPCSVVSGGYSFKAMKY